MSDRTFWHKQTSDKPLFEDLLWSRPENRALAGKLGIIGGNNHGFASPAEAYTRAIAAGVGNARVLLPASLKSTIGRVFEAGEYAPSTPSGGFSQKALAEILDLSMWSDGLLLSGDLGHNSEISILLEALVSKYSERLTVTNDALDYFTINPLTILDRPNSLIVIDLTNLQKLAVNAHFTQAFTSTIDFLRLVDLLHDFTKDHKIAIVLKHLTNYFVAFKGEVSTTHTDDAESDWTTKVAAKASVWWLQNPSKTFEALTCSLIEQ